MKIRKSDLENMTPAVLATVLIVLNASPDSPLEMAQNRRNILDRTISAQRRLIRKSARERATTAHVVKRGNWGLVEVLKAGLNAKGGRMKKRFSDSHEPKARWSRGRGKRWPLEDAERYAKLFGGRVRP